MYGKLILINADGEVLALDAEILGEVIREGRFSFGIRGLSDEVTEGGKALDFIYNTTLEHVRKKDPVPQAIVIPGRVTIWCDHCNEYIPHTRHSDFPDDAAYAFECVECGRVRDFVPKGDDDE